VRSELVWREGSRFPAGASAGAIGGSVGVHVLGVGASELSAFSFSFHWWLPQPIEIAPVSYLWPNRFSFCSDFNPDFAVLVWRNKLQADFGNIFSLP